MGKFPYLLIGILLIIASYLSAVNPGITAIEHLDIDILYFFNNNRLEILDPVLRFITNFNTIICVCTLLVFTAFALKQKDRKLQYKGLGLWISWGLAILISTIIKYSVDRIRPFETYGFIDKLSSAGSPSFPSGHTTEVFSLMLAICFLFPENKIRNIALLLWACLIAYTRMALGVHYPSDVLAGFGIALVSSSLISQLYYRKAH